MQSRFCKVDSGCNFAIKPEKKKSGWEADQQITLKAIAEETGFTVATVSRALSGKDRLAPATRAKVREAAERLGYRPDPMLSRLAAYRSATGGDSGDCGVITFWDAISNMA